MPFQPEKHIAIFSFYQSCPEKRGSVRLGNLALCHTRLAADARIDGVFIIGWERHDLVVVAGHLGIGTGLRTRSAFAQVMRLGIRHDFLPKGFGSDNG
jgi:hypothetical protein